MNLAVFGFFILPLLSGFGDPIMGKSAMIAEVTNKLEMKNQVVGAKLFHPRILLTDSVLNVLKNQAKTDALLQKYFSQVIADADRRLPHSTLTYAKPDGLRLLETSQECLNRILYIGLAYRLTGNEKYAIAAKKILLDVCAFPDWNPVHFIDVSEMTNAVGIGYDWIYNYLDQKSRTKIETAILNYGLDPYLLADKERKWITQTPYNFNPVSNGGAIIGALAVADIYPEKSKEVVQTAVSNLPIALRSYAPDGIWPEGGGYWEYATSYMVYGIQALQVAMGTDFGLTKTNGFSNAGNFIIYYLSPGGYTLHFGDSKTYERFDRPKLSLFWLGKQFNHQSWINIEHKFIATTLANPLHVIDYAPPAQEVEAKKLDMFFSGNMPVSIFRNAWDDPQAFFLGAKGGENSQDHCHLDLGNFEMEVLGVRWAYDLGWDNYNMTGYWDKVQGGQRWSYYRCNSHSHNVPMINNKDQLIAGKAVVISHAENITEPYIAFDLTSAYKNDANRVTREIKIINNRNTAQITDVFNLKAQADIYWGMTTPAAIEVLNNGEALLTKSGKTLKAKIVSPEGLHFYSESCYQTLPQNPNAGFSRLMIKTNQPKGVTTLKITLMPDY